MGFLDFLFDQDKKDERKYAKLEKTLTNMYVQAAERGYVIEQLVEMRTPEAVRVLLKRFGDASPNTTVDLEEKERIYSALVELGADTRLDVIGLVRDHLRKVEDHVNWPLKVLSDLLSYEEFTGFLAELLADCSEEYTQNPAKKQELILRAQEIASEPLTLQLVRFLEDMNETVRFLAVDAVIKQERPDLTTAPLAAMLAREESLRIVQKLATAFANHQDWKVPAELRSEVAEALPDEYGIHDQGHVYKHRR